MNLIKKLISGLEKKFLVFTVLSPLAMVGEVLMETTIPLVMAKIVDVGIANKDAHFVVRYGLLMVFMSIVSLFFGVSCGRLSSMAAFGFSRNLRRKLFRKVQSFSFSNMDKFGTGSLVTRLTTDVTNIQNLYQNLIRTAVRSPLMLISGTVMASFINFRLACIFFVVIPVLGSILLLIVSIAYPRFGEMFKKYDGLNKAVQENLIGIRVVKAFVRGRFEEEKFDNVAENLRESQVRAEKIVIWNMPIMQFVIYGCIVSALWFGGNMILRGQMQMGELISFISYIAQIMMSLMMLSMMFVQFILSRASVARISEILDEVPDILSENQGGESLPLAPARQRSYATPSSGDPPRNTPQDYQKSDSQRFVSSSSYTIDFENVFFSYTKNAGNCVLTDINLHIPAGSTVGIIGGTGSSKTTLIQLIPRLYEVTKGAVKVGGKDVREWNLDSLRETIGIVLQKNVLFSGTIAENLRWGNKNATDEELVEACKAADAHSFVSGFPNGYETYLDQGGINLSGGQKQRLCIARALLKKPKILILDDSTSAVDTATDLRIRNALKNCLPDSTKLIIAQRLASVQDADFIVVMDDGKINAIGTHTELLATNKIYQEVYESQMSEN